LSQLGYDKDPSLLQLLIQSMYTNGTRSVQVQGVEMVYLPMFQVLNGKDTRDYAMRVEPSPQGGHKMAQAIVEHACAPFGTHACSLKP
jgi:hypothetical protein